MFTNEKVLGLILIIFTLGAISYFAFTKLKQDINQAQASPSPSPTPAALNFMFNEKSSSNKSSPQPTQAAQQAQPQPQPKATELPLSKNKRLAQFPGLLKADDLQNKKAVIQTARGIIQLQIYPEASIAASNFMILAANGFYDGLTFHRVEPGFVIQGGDPDGDGTGGPGYQFIDEAVTRDYKKGTVAMANAGPNTNGSQFFIMLEDHPELSKKYTIFGQVISGQDIVEKIKVGDVMQSVVIQHLQ